MPGAEASLRKQDYFGRVNKLLTEYNKILLVGADNVGSSQMQRVRKAMRGKAELLMGKNTMIRKVIRGLKNPNLEQILYYVKGNIGFVLVKDDLASVRKIISENKVPAAAKAGTISPVDVTVPAGPTGMEPTQTSFLQALNIPSKIVKGQVEIVNDVLLVKKGTKVGTSEATLLQKLNIKPFFYGLAITTVYDSGSIYDVAVLDLTDDEILKRFQSGVKNVAAVSLAINYPTVASVPHSLLNGYKNVISVAMATEISFKQADKMKEILANPGAFAAVAAPASGAPAKKEEAKKEEPKEEEDEDMGFGLFD